MRHATSNNDLVEVDVSEELLLQASLDLKKSEKEAREEADLEELVSDEARGQERELGSGQAGGSGGRMDDRMP